MNLESDCPSLSHKNNMYCERCISIQIHLCNLTSEILSDDYLTANPSIRKYLKSNSKGFVPFQLIFQQPNIKSFLSNLKLSVQEQKIVLRQSINKYGKTIFCSNKGIRRTTQYKNRCRSFKPLLIEHVKDDFNLTQLRTKFGPRTSILNGKIMQFDKVNYVIVYAQDFREFDRQEFKGDPNFSLFNYEQFWRQLQMQGSLLQNQVKFEYCKSNEALQGRTQKRAPFRNRNQMRIQNEQSHDDSSNEDVRDRLQEEAYHEEMFRMARGCNRQAEEHLRRRQQPEEPKPHYQNQRLIACLQKCVQRESNANPLHRKISSLSLN